MTVIEFSFGAASIVEQCSFGPKATVHHHHILSKFGGLGDLREKPLRHRANHTVNYHRQWRL
jgi:hypothetical protein